jgi:anthranilate phosphoribosyltransferase
VTRQLTGVADRRYLQPIADAFARLGAVHVLVVSSDDGLDELSTAAPSQVEEVREGDRRGFTLDAAEVGLDAARPDELTGGTPEVNAEITRRILAGERGAPRDLAVLNAGAAIYVSGRAATPEQGVRAAEAAIDDGAARAKLERFVACTRELAPA